MATLFAIENGKASSGGVKLEFGKNQPNGEKFPFQLEGLVLIGPDGKPRLRGNIVWSGGTLGELWHDEAEFFQFILDNYSVVAEKTEEV